MRSGEDIPGSDSERLDYKCAAWLSNGWFSGTGSEHFPNISSEVMWSLRVKRSDSKTRDKKKRGWETTPPSIFQSVETERRQQEYSDGITAWDDDEWPSSWEERGRRYQGRSVREWWSSEFKEEKLKPTVNEEKRNRVEKETSYSRPQNETGVFIRTKKRGEATSEERVHTTPKEFIYSSYGLDHEVQGRGPEYTFYNMFWTLRPLN